MYSYLLMYLYHIHIYIYIMYVCIMCLCVYAYIHMYDLPKFCVSTSYDRICSFTHPPSMTHRARTAFLYRVQLKNQS